MARSPANTRYFALFNSIFLGGEDIVIWEVTKQAFNCLKPEHNEAKFDRDYTSATNQFNMRFGGDTDSDDVTALDDEEPIDFGENPLIATFGFTSELFASVMKTGSKVECIELTLSPSDE